MLKNKQIEGFDSLANIAIVNMELSADGKTVNLTRADGEEFTFVTRADSGIKGPTGDRGATGSRGESAYDIAKRLSLTSASTSSAWLTSLKGEKGPTGADGTAGANGNAGANGSVPTFSIGTTSWLAAGSAPTLNVSQSGLNYTLTFGVPNGANGTAATNGTKPTLKIGTVTLGTTDGGSASASLTSSGTTYSLNMTIPKGEKGTDASASSSTAKNGIAPNISFVVNYISHGSSPSVSYSGSQSSAGSDWTRTVTLNIPKGETGDEGDQGAQGASGSATSAKPEFTAITDSFNAAFPGSGMGAFIMANNELFTGDPLTHVCFGLSWKHSSGSSQVVYTYHAPTDSSCRWWARGYRGSASNFNSYPWCSEIN